MTIEKPAVVPFFGLRLAPSASRPRDERPGIGGLAPDELAAWFTERGHPAYRARQVLDAAWSGREATFDDVLTLPGPLRAELAAAFRFDTVEESEIRHTDGALTEKAVHRLVGRARSSSRC